MMFYNMNTFAAQQPIPFSVGGEVMACTTSRWSITLPLMPCGGRGLGAMLLAQKPVHQKHTILRSIV